MLHEKDGARIKFKRVCPEEGKEVANEEIIRGYELGPSQYVTFTDEELEAASPEASRMVEIVDFVRLEEIDPTYYNKTYFVVPDKNAEKAYHLLRQALESAQKVGIARMVMREKEYLVAIRPKGDVLLLETMHFADEVVPADDVAKGAGVQVDKRQLALAEKLIETLTTTFDPERYKSEHRERILELIDQKAAGKEIVVEPEAKPAVRTTDLMAALEKSLAGLKSRTTPGVGHKPKAHAKAAAGKSAHATHGAHATHAPRKASHRGHPAAAKEPKDRKGKAAA